MIKIAHRVFLGVVVVVLLSFSHAAAQSTSTMEVRLGNLGREMNQLKEDVQRLNELVAESAEKDTETHYEEILEKTNQQLGLWSNPYGLMVGTLAVLFTILTIIAAYIIYSQSREYKNKLQEDRNEYRKNLDTFLKEQKAIIDARNQQAEQIEKKISEVVIEYEKKLNTASAEQKEEIQKAINDLKSEKATLRSQTSVLSSGVGWTADSLGALSMNAYHKCSHCGFGYYVPNNSLSATAGYIYSNRNTCPSCGNVE